MRPIVFKCKNTERVGVSYFYVPEWKKIFLLPSNVTVNKSVYIYIYIISSDDLNLVYTWNFQ